MHGDAFIIECLRDIGIHEIDMQDTNHIQKFLRIRMVEEWNTNQEYYQGFLTVDITTITHEFLQSGHLSGCLGGSDGINPGQYLADSNNNFHLCSKYAITMHHANNTNYINNTTNIPYIHTKWSWTL